MGTLKHVQSWPTTPVPVPVPPAAAADAADSPAGITIHVTPPDGEEEEDEFVPPPSASRRVRRKLSSPPSLRPERVPSKSLSALDGTRRRFSTMMVSSAAAAAVSRRLSATIGWCLATPAQVTPQIIRQGRALCIQYIRQQIKRSSVSCKKVILQRLKTTLETECGAEAGSLHESGALTALTALCGALERTRPDLFRQVARQAARAPHAVLRSDAALADLSLAVAREICKENITWCKIAAVYCVCGALAREAVCAGEAAAVGAAASEGGGEASGELVCAPAAAVADLLQDEVGVWVATHGGWGGLMAHVRASERDRRGERNLHVLVGVMVAACASLAVLRWLLPAPAYHHD